MEIESNDSVNQLVKVEFKLGKETYTIDETKGDTVLDQLVSMKEQSMLILKDFITKHNVTDDIVFLEEESLSDEEDESLTVKCLVKPKKTKI
ncbi:unnamed protein product [Cochlearia groenlandica]